MTFFYRNRKDRRSWVLGGDARAQINTELLTDLKRMRREAMRRRDHPSVLLCCCRLQQYAAVMLLLLLRAAAVVVLIYELHAVLRKKSGAIQRPINYYIQLSRRVPRRLRLNLPVARPACERLLTADIYKYTTLPTFLLDRPRGPTEE